MAYGIFEDWEEACHRSAAKTAWAKWPQKEQDKRGRWVDVTVVKPLNGDPYLRYKTADIKIRQMRAHEINHIRRWSPY